VLHRQQALSKRRFAGTGSFETALTDFADTGSFGNELGFANTGSFGTTLGLADTCSFEAALLGSAHTLFALFARRRPPNWTNP
jgi:hypothetical protein